MVRVNAQSAPVAPNIPYGPIISGAFALLVLVGTAEPWTSQWGARGTTGLDYTRGIIAAIASVTALGVCLVVSMGAMAKRQYLALILILSVTMLAMPLWVFTAVVGTPDPGWNDPNGRLVLVEDATIMGRTGLGMTILAATGSISSIAYQAASHVRRWPRRIEAPTPVLLNGAFAMFVVVGALMPWAEGLRWSQLGVQYAAGLIALVAAIEIMIVVALRAFGHTTQEMYLGFAGPAAAIALGAIIWFHRVTIGDADTAYERLLSSFCTRDPCGTIGAEPGLAVATIAAFGCAAALLADGRTSIRGVRDARTSRRARRLTAILRGFPIIRRADN